MPLLDKIASALGGNVAEGASKIVDSVAQFFNTPEEKHEFELKKAEMVQAVQNEMNRHNEVAAENVTRELELEMKNTSDARAMQNVAVTQEDIFSKRFIYYLTSFWSLGSVAYVFFITFYKVENERVMDTILGFLLGTIIASIMNYFFGSSAGSKRNADSIRNIAEKNT